MRGAIRHKKAGSMVYNAANKEAWEEAFEKHQQGYKVDPADRLLDPEGTFLDEPVIEALNQIGVAGKVAGQFCCNNGRELLSVVKMGARTGIGFDIAENFIEEARRIAKKAGLSASFHATDIADIPATFDDTVDVGLITAGALTWFGDLGGFFQKVARVLAPGGTLLIHEIHPYTNMLAMAGEPPFDAAHPDRVAYSYFRTEPWVETDGVDYVGGTTYASKPFYSYSHTVAGIINAIARSGMVIEEMHEYPKDVSSSFGHLDDQGIPLSYLLRARKGG
jgi:SAM-dependent methyltransferase